MPAKIPLSTNDKAIIIDYTDYERVSAHGWCVNGVGYVVASIDNAVTYLSRFLLDVPDGYVVIHHNGNRLDFRRDNLRVVTRSEAMQRQRKRAGTTNKYKGVQRHKPSGRWRATLWQRELRRSVHLGYFECEVDATKAYDDAWVNFG